MVIITMFLGTGCIRTTNVSNNLDDIQHIERFDTLIYRYAEMSDSQRDSFRTRFHNVVRIILPLTGHNVTADNDSILKAYSRSKAVTMFTAATLRLFTSTDSIEHVLGNMHAKLHDMLPDMSWPHMIAITSTYNQSILISDSIMLIGLNHYLGPDFEGYRHFPPYQRKTKSPQYLPSNIAEAIIRSHISPTETDHTSSTLLSRILREGAIAYIVMDLSGTPSENIVLGWDDSDLKWARDNEPTIWQSMIERKILFSTDPALADRLIRPTPHSAVIHPECPGRIGVYIGLKIVEAYISRHPEITAEELLSDGFNSSPHTLQEAAYYPQ